MQRALREVAKKIEEITNNKMSASLRKAEAEFVTTSVMLLGNEGGFEIVGIGLDEKKDEAQAFIKKLTIPWINLWDSRKKASGKSWRAMV